MDIYAVTDGDGRPLFSFWRPGWIRRPGRRDEERKQFAALMRKVEAVRIRYGMTKTELAAKLGANVDGVRAWMTGRTVGRKGTVERILRFLERNW